MCQWLGLIVPLKLYGGKEALVFIGTALMGPQRGAGSQFWPRLGGWLWSVDVIRIDHRAFLPHKTHIFKIYRDQWAVLSHKNSHLMHQHPKDDTCCGPPSQASSTVGLCFLGAGPALLWWVWIWLLIFFLHQFTQIYWKNLFKPHFQGNSCVFTPLL